MKPLVIALLAGIALSAGAGAETFVGTIADDMCVTADHSHMRMGSTDAECTVACVDAHGAAYVLYDGRNAYTLSARQTLERFAGQSVRITGTLDAKTRTIRVDSVARTR
jgi:hypothetical protein